MTVKLIKKGSDFIFFNVYWHSFQKLHLEFQNSNVAKLLRYGDKDVCGNMIQKQIFRKNWRIIAFIEGGKVSWFMRKFGRF